MCRFLIAVLLLSACGAPKLAAIDLEPLLIQAGDLPGGLAAGQVRDVPQPTTISVPKPQKSLMQLLNAPDGTLAGSVAVLLYDSSADVKTVYALAQSTASLPGVGEQALVNTADPAFIDASFVRCHAVGTIHASRQYVVSVDALKAYAKRLDERLKAQVC